MADRKIIENQKNDECEIVKEVRETRYKISARFDHDVGRLVAYYRELKEEYLHDLVMEKILAFRVIENEPKKIKKA